MAAPCAQGVPLRGGRHAFADMVPYGTLRQKDTKRIWEKLWGNWMKLNEIEITPVSFAPWQESTSWAIDPHRLRQACVGPRARALHGFAKSFPLPFSSRSELASAERHRWKAAEHLLNMACCIAKWLKWLPTVLQIVWASFWAMAWALCRRSPAGSVLDEPQMKEMKWNEMKWKLRFASLQFVSGFWKAAKRGFPILQPAPSESAQQRTSYSTDFLPLSKSLKLCHLRHLSSYALIC